MEAIAKEIEADPKTVIDAPATTPVSRLDEGAAARVLDVKFRLD